MDFAGYRYYRPNKLFLSMVGLWPERSARFGLIHFCCYLFLISAFVPQLIPLARRDDTLDILLKNLPCLTFCAMSLLKYSTFVVNSDVMQILLDEIRRDWKGIRSKEELRIYKKYARIGRLQTIVYAVFVYVSVFSTVVLILMPILLNQMDPQSEPIKVNLPIVMDYLIEGDMYNIFFPLLHYVPSMLLTLTVLFSTETMYFMCVKHACGLFNVARYRIVEAYSSSFMRPLLPARKSAVYGAVVGALRDHEKAQKFVATLQDHFMFLYFVQILLGVIMLTGNLYRLSQLFLPNSQEIGEIIMILALTGGQLCVMFYINYEAGQVTEECHKFYIYPYRTEWYEAPLCVQKLLLIILGVGEKVRVLDLFGVYYPSIEGFASHFKLSWSYFMMLHSMQQL